MSAGDADQGRITGETRGVGSSAEAYCATCDQSYPTDRATCPVDGSALVVLPDESEDELLGRVLEGRFEIREQLGAGGMGTVYRAFQSSVGRDVAIKVIDKAVSRDREAVKRFMREAQLASKLNHPNTVVVHDFGQTHDGVVYLVMELLDGETLRTVLRRTGPMARDTLIELGIQLCDALDTAHSQGIIHRDLKPGNVMLLAHSGQRQLLKVLDFGLAKSLASDTTELSSSHVRMGTPMYMSPEMINAEEVDARSDLYALGCTLYEMASGQPPFVARRAEILFALHLEEQPKPLERDDLGAVAPLILELLAKRAEDRPSSAAEVRAQLRAEAGRTTDKGARTPVAKPSAVASATTGLAEAETVDLRGADSDPVSGAPRSSKRAWGLALAVLLLAGAGVTLLMLERTRGSERDRRTSDQSAVAARVADAGIAKAAADAHVAAVPVAPAAAKVELRLESSPAAEVTVDGKPAGKTPTSFEAVRGDRELEVVFKRRGYADAHRRVVPSQPRTVRAELHKLRRRSRHRPRHAPRTKPAVPEKPVTVVAPKPEPKPEPVKKSGDPDPSSIFRLGKDKTKNK